MSISRRVTFSLASVVAGFAFAVVAFGQSTEGTPAPKPLSPEDEIRELKRRADSAELRQKELEGKVAALQKQLTAAAAAIKDEAGARGDAITKANGAAAKAAEDLAARHETLEKSVAGAKKDAADRLAALEHVKAGERLKNAEAAVAAVKAKADAIETRITGINFDGVSLRIFVKKYTFDFQGDGNFVIRSDGKPVWATNTHNK
jgi:hypothetical protein